MSIKRFQQRWIPVLRPELRDAAILSSRTRSLLAGAAVLALAACDGETLDWDLRRPGTGLDTTPAAQQAAARRPRPDARGVIAFPTYEMAEARRGDTVASLAARVGLPADEVARYNGLAPDTPLRAGEVIALPRRDAGAAGAAPAGGGIDITALAGTAIDRAEAAAPAPASPPAPPPGGNAPARHQVVRGETAYSIARLYNVSPRSLAEWNGLGPDLSVREGQFLVIPEGPAGAAPAADTAAPVSAPGEGSPTPVPPSAVRPLPRETPPAAAAPATAAPVADLGASRTDSARMAMPVDGPIIRPYARGSNDGIDIGAPAGSPVRAAADGTIAAITTDTDGVTIVVVRHADSLLTVYANVADVAVTRDARVSRGQTIAAVRAGDPSFLHFEVRQGFESTDPMPYLN